MTFKQIKEKYPKAYEEFENFYPIDPQEKLRSAWADLTDHFDGVGISINSGRNATPAYYASICVFNGSYLMNELFPSAIKSSRHESETAALVKCFEIRESQLTKGEKK